MGEPLYAANSFQEVFEKLSNKMFANNDYLLEGIMPYFMANPQRIIISTNIENTGRFERMNFYDPLYSSEYIRSMKNSVIIEFKLDVNDDYSRLDQDYKEKVPGFLKLRYSSNCYEWRECKIKTSNQAKRTAKLASSTIRNKSKILY